MIEQKVKICAYIIDSFKVDSPQHKSVRVYQNSSFSIIPRILGIRTDQKNHEVVQIIALQNLQKIQNIQSLNQQQKVNIVYNVLQALWYMHQKQQFTGQVPLEQFIYKDLNSKSIKIKPYKSVPFSKISNLDVKNDKKSIKNQNQLFERYEQRPQFRDIWKWALFTCKIIFSFSLEKYLQKISTLQKEKVNQFIPQIGIKHQFINSNLLLNILIQLLKLDGKHKQKIEQIIPIFQKILLEIHFPYDQKYVQAIKSSYLQNEKKYKSQFQIQIKQEIILTEDLKKKIANQFVKNAQKPPKSFKALYRATRVQFNTRVFYQSCCRKGCLLFLIQTDQSGTICCYIDPVIQINDSFGFAGHSISDPSLKSFIYSTKSQELFKLIVKDKAFKFVPGKGPIIGDGDIILGNNRQNNWCYFPKSFQSGKTKKLTSKPKFSIKNYDVYELLF